MHALGSADQIGRLDSLCHGTTRAGEAIGDYELHPCSVLSSNDLGPGVSGKSVVTWET
jgi:hypothetical protein